MSIDVNDEQSEAGIDADLRRLDLTGLRQQWRNLSGRNAAPGITRALLVRLIAYQRQVDRHGGLPSEAERFLVQIAAKNVSGGNKAANTSLSERVAGAARSVGTDRKYPPGTILVREWQGVLQRVTVMKEGFAWNGSVFRSLSRVAREITGTAWNGHVFFGGADRGLATRRRKADRTRVGDSFGPGASP